MESIVDTHTHLYDAVFDPDRSSVLERAHLAGISAIISVAEGLADAEKNLELSAQHRMIRPAAGLYPTSLDLDLAGKMHDFIRSNRYKLAAIGEVGLDYWVVKNDSQKEVQREIFRGFIDLSKELMLPLNVHSRSAGRHAISLLLECGASKVQLHAFDGKSSAAMPAVEAGYFFSIPPSIVRSRQKQRLVKKLPLTNLLIVISLVYGQVLAPRSRSGQLVAALVFIMAGMTPEPFKSHMMNFTELQKPLP
jgi:TatD DNase family protein